MCAVTETTQIASQSFPTGRRTGESGKSPPCSRHRALKPAGRISVVPSDQCRQADLIQKFYFLQPPVGLLLGFMSKCCLSVFPTQEECTNPPPDQESHPGLLSSVQTSVSVVRAVRPPGALVLLYYRKKSQTGFSLSHYRVLFSLLLLSFLYLLSLFLIV